MADPKAQQQESSAIGATEVGDFDSLLKKEFKPKTDEAKEAVERAVRTLAEQALSQTKLISADVVKSIEAIIAQLDKKLTEQINLILHHEDFQKMEGAWRGLHYLVNNTETDEMLKIRFMNISNRILARRSSGTKGPHGIKARCSRSSTTRSTGQFGGEPFGCLVGDYYFDHTPPDTELLGEMAQVAAAAHTPFIAGTSPTIMQMSSWQELANPRDLTKIFTTPEYAAWRSLRESEDSRYLGLAMPRYLSRLPYGRRPTRSRSSRSKRTPAPPITAATRGPTPPTRWRPTSTARSSCTAGARASAASSRAARSKGFRFTRSRPTTAAWT
jgi:type VI secretion system protein ImpC